MTSHYPVARTAVRLLLAGSLTLLVSCAVRAYHPLEGLYAPVVVNVQHPNFEGMRIRVHCVSEGDPGSDVERTLCGRLGALFEAQGATVATSYGVNLIPDEADPAATSPDMSVQLTNRIIRRTYRWGALPGYILTLTLAPLTDETIFAQDLEIRDREGFLIATETFQGRMLTRFGLGPGIGTWLANMRQPKNERLTNANTDRAFSEDVYGRISQAMYNAKVKAQLLGRLDPAPADELDDASTEPAPQPSPLSLPGIDQLPDIEIEESQ